MKKEKDTRHNGWTNYATWRVNLEIFDGMGCADSFGETGFGKEDADGIKDFAKEAIFAGVPDGLCKDYAEAWLEDVNWQEILRFYKEGK